VKSSCRGIDPLYLYTDLVVAIRPEDKINNGEPSFHAKLMAAIAAASMSCISAPAPVPSPPSWRSR
jgi:hypothetical protein